MKSRTSWQIDDVNARMRRLKEYKETVVRLFPTLPRSLVDDRSVSYSDALVLGLFLDRCPPETTALDIGTSVGSSAFYLASHPQVRKVVSVYRNPAPTGTNADLELSQGGQPLELARATLAEFPREQKKVSFHHGSEVPALEEDGTAFVAFVGGHSNREGVHADLSAVCAGNPRAKVVLTGCRGERGPLVQAGAVDFVQAAPEKYRFRLLGDLGPSLASSGLGVVYPETRIAETEDILEYLGGDFSEKLDLLRALSREEDLVGLTNRLRRELNQVRKSRVLLKERASELEGQVSQLKSEAKVRAKNTAALKGHVTAVKSQNQNLQAQAQKLERQIQAVQSSTSWRLLDKLNRARLKVLGKDK